MQIENLAWHWQNTSEADNLILKNLLIQSIGDHQVLIKNQAIGINPVDWKLIDGLGDILQKDQIPGVDGMGIVVAVGKEMQHIRLGARYTYHTDLRFNGSFSQQTLVDGRALIAVPDILSDIAAAAFPCPVLTAWQAFQKLPTVCGENILVNSAGSAVGGTLTQLLLNAGARVYVTASQHRHLDLLNKGVVAAFDYHHNDWQEQLKQRLGKQSLFAIFDTVNGQSAHQLASLLGFYGHLISIQDRVEQAPLPAFTTSISLHEIALASTHAFGTDRQWTKLTSDGQQLLDKIAIGAINLPTIKVVGFNDIPYALNELKQRNNGIKYVAITE